MKTYSAEAYELDGEEIFILTINENQNNMSYSIWRDVLHCCTHFVNGEKKITFWFCCQQDMDKAVKVLEGAMFVPIQ